MIGTKAFVFSDKACVIRAFSKRRLKRGGWFAVGPRMTPSGLTPSTALTTTSHLCRGLAIGRQYVPASKRSGDTAALYLDAFQFTSFCRSRFSEARTRVFERTETRQMP
jgi:hypothetical protein